MKSIVVPRTSIPPAIETLVIQVTPKEAVEILEMCHTYQNEMYYKSLASAGLIKHIEEFLKRFETMQK